MIETELTMLKIQLLVSTFLIAIISISIQIGNNFGLRMKMASKNTRPFS